MYFVKFSSKNSMVWKKNLCRDPENKYNLFQQKNKILIANYHNSELEHV